MSDGQLHAESVPRGNWCLLVGVQADLQAQTAGGLSGYLLGTQRSSQLWRQIIIHSYLQALRAQRPGQTFWAASGRPAKAASAVEGAPGACQAMSALVQRHVLVLHA